MKEEVFYNKTKGGSCPVHLIGHCHMQTLFPADFYCIPKHNITIMSQYEEKKEWSLLNLKIIPKDAVKIEVDGERISAVMDIYHELKRAEKKELEKLSDYQKKNSGKWPDGKSLSEIFSSSSDLQRKFQSACEDTFVPPIS